MKKQILTTISLVCTLLLSVFVATAADFAPGRASAKGNISVSRANNLRERIQIAQTPDARIKTLPVGSRTAAPKKKGLSIDARKSPASKAIAEETSALMFESFESCEYLSDATPDGWTSLSKGDTPMPTDDHWIGFSKAYADYNMFAPPIHGSMMFGIFYNDEAYKDEWIVSPRVTIPSDQYELSFYWYTLPYYLYVIDRFHVDFDNKVFTNRELLFDVEVLVKADDADWESIFHLEELFSGLEYSDLEVLDYDTMQQVKLRLDKYAGKTVQIAFRYFGEGGNSFFLDAVRIDLPLPTVSMMPHYSRLFYGFSPDEDLWWLDASVEFYPVGHPVEWYNTSADIDKCDFRWDYCNLDDSGQMAWSTSDDPESLQVTYAPDYSSAVSLTNNFYFLPRLKGRSPQGGISDFAPYSSDFLQAGGTTEYTPDGIDFTKYVALDFDIINEGFGLHLEEDEELGFLAEPIFGRSVNTDAWWEHYCFPKGKRDDQYAYVDGFANMFLPHPTAPLVVKGISAAALGKIYPEAQFTMNVYTMDENGAVIETPLATKTIAGADVLKVPGYSTSGDYLVLDFPLDEPLIFDTKNTGYGYIVEVCGYHDDKIEYFAPIQSTVPNEYEWCLGFYHIHHSGKDDLTNELSYVAFFKDYLGRDLYSSFAIGLDAHYPWLEMADADNPFTAGADGSVSFTIHGYYAGADYTVKAPDGIDVKVADDRYSTVITVSRPADSSVQTVPVAISAPGVSLTVDVDMSSSAIGDITADSSAASADVYSAQGILIKRNASADDLQHLPAGLYIFNGRKVIVK